MSADLEVRSPQPWRSGFDADVREGVGAATVTDQQGVAAGVVACVFAFGVMRRPR